MSSDYEYNQYNQYNGCNDYNTNSKLNSIPYKKKYNKKNDKTSYKNHNKNINNDSHNDNDYSNDILKFKYKSIINNESNYYEEMSIYDFIKNINSIVSSKNIMDISKSINLTNTSIISYAASEANKFKSALKGSNTLFIYKHMLDKIKCDINPTLDSHFKKSLATVKWKLYDFMIKKQEKRNNGDTTADYETEIINWLAMLVGIYLYFDEKDEVNFKQSTLLDDVCKPMTPYSFK